MKTSNRIKQTTELAFSPAIKIESKKIHIIYKITLNSLDIKKDNNLINGDLTPIAYLFKENEIISINPINEKYTNYINNPKNKIKILKKFEEIA